MNQRWVIAHDEEGYHVRKTLWVTHDGNRYEAVYHTKPIGSRKSLAEAVKLARTIQRKKRRA